MAGRLAICCYASISGSVGVLPHVTNLRNVRRGGGRRHVLVKLALTGRCSGSMPTVTATRAGLLSSRRRAAGVKLMAIDRARFLSIAYGTHLNV